MCRNKNCKIIRSQKMMEKEKIKYKALITLELDKLYKVSWSCCNNSKQIVLKSIWCSHMLTWYKGTKCALWFRLWNCCAKLHCVQLNNSFFLSYFFLLLPVGPSPCYELFLISLLLSPSPFPIWSHTLSLSPFLSSTSFPYLLPLFLICSR